jgi:hypothetical protein
LVTALRYASSLLSGGDLMELDQLKRREFITLIGDASSAGIVPIFGILSF